MNVKKIKPELVIFTGPMYSEKTTTLIRALRRQRIAGRSVVIFSPKCDTRSGEGKIITNTKDMHEDCITIDEKQPQLILEYLSKHPEVDIIGIDEVQFWSNKIEMVIKKILASSRKVYVAGLKADFKERPFGVLPKLMVWADDIKMLPSVCQVCGDEDAAISKRVINSSEQVAVGGKDAYIAICRRCKLEEGKRKFK